MAREYTFERIRPYRKELLPNGEWIQIYDQAAVELMRGRRMFQKLMQANPDDLPEGPSNKRKGAP